MLCRRWLRVALVLAMSMAEVQARIAGRAVSSSSTSSTTSLSSGLSSGLSSIIASSSESLSSLTSAIQQLSTTTSSSRFSTTSSSALHTSSSSPSTITSCVPHPVSILDFLVPSLTTLPVAQKNAALAFVIAKYTEVIRNFVRIAADPTAPGAAALAAYYFSLYNDVVSEVIALFGPDGYAYLNLQGIPDSCLLSTCVSQFRSQSSSYVKANPAGIFFYQAQAPCCQQCTLFAQAVSLDYWPTPAPLSHPSTLIDTKAGITFVSPSVYGFFTGLYAADRCGLVGKSYQFATFAFGPTDLSTSSIPVNPNLLTTFTAAGKYTAINYADFGTQCTCKTNCPIDPIFGTTLTNLCTPQLSFPPQVTALDPAWAKCVSENLGVFDPPVALPQVQGLTTPKSIPANPTSPIPDSQPPATSPAAPVNVPTPVVPSPTAQSALAVPSSAAPPGPPGSSPLVPASGASSPVVVPAGGNPTSAGGVSTPLPPGAASVPPGAASVQPGAASVQPGAASVRPAAGSVAPGAASVPPAAVSVGTGTPPLIINGQTITANSQSAFVVGTQTLVPGAPAITVSGTPISLSPGGTVVVIGGTTSSLGVAVSAGATEVGASGGAGGAGGAGATTRTGTETGAAPAVFTGGASRMSAFLMARSMFAAAAISLLIIR